MGNPDGLHLHEELLLLALHDRKGTIEQSMYGYAIGGAILAELLLRGRLTVVEGRRPLVELADPTPTGEPILDEALARVRAAKRRAATQTWVTRFAGMKDLKHRIARRLCQRGILRMKEDQVLLIFTRKVYPQVDPAPERRLVARIRDAVLSDRDDVDPRTVVLVSLARNASLLGTVFEKHELKARKARIERIAKGGAAGAATAKAIEQVQAALMVAAIVPAMVVVTSS